MKKKFFILGAPNAGKSTYLAALWYSVNQNNVKTKMSLKKMNGDSQYLYNLQKKWLEVEQLERTGIGQEMPEISLLLTDGQDELELEFPDFSGETFQNIYESREMSHELYDKIYEADAILYFVNIENIHSPEFISEIPTQLRGLENDNDKNEKKFKLRKPCDDDPTQVQIIELLQAIAEIKKEGTMLGIIFSAWDLIPDMENVNPRKYLEEHMNMLWQYIECNFEKFKTSVWGVSAFGGTLEDSEILLNHDEPVNRIKVVNEKNIISHDVTIIVAEMAGE